MTPIVISSLLDAVIGFGFLFILVIGVVALLGWLVFLVWESVDGTLFFLRGIVHNIKESRAARAH